MLKNFKYIKKWLFSSLLLILTSCSTGSDQASSGTASYDDTDTWNLLFANSGMIELTAPDNSSDTFTVSLSNANTIDIESGPPYSSDSSACSVNSSLAAVNKHKKTKHYKQLVGATTYTVTLAEGATCDLWVQAINPTGLGSNSATLKITDGASGNSNSFTVKSQEYLYAAGEFSDVYEYPSSTVDWTSISSTSTPTGTTNEANRLVVDPNTQNLYAGSAETGDLAVYTPNGGWTSMSLSSSLTFDSITALTFDYDSSNYPYLYVAANTSSTDGYVNYCDVSTTASDSENGCVDSSDWNPTAATGDTINALSALDNWIYASGLMISGSDYLQDYWEAGNSSTWSSCPTTDVRFTAEPKASTIAAIDSSISNTGYYLLTGISYDAGPIDALEVDPTTGPDCSTSAFGNLGYDNSTDFQKAFGVAANANVSTDYFYVTLHTDDSSPINYVKQFTPTSTGASSQVYNQLSTTASDDYIPYGIVVDDNGSVYVGSGSGTVYDCGTSSNFTSTTCNQITTTTIGSGGSVNSLALGTVLTITSD